MKLWQFIAGGGEDGETHIETAKREAFEEAGFEFWDYTEAGTNKDFETVY